MTFDPKKIFDAAYKKNKILTCFVCCMSIFALSSIVVTSFYKIKNIVNTNRDTVITHSSEIDHIKRSLDEYDELSRLIVTRPSFNAYIKRKDAEYHEQNELNNMTSAKVGHLEGEIFILSRLFNHYNSKERDADNE